MRIDLQYLRCRNAFRISEIAVDDHRAAQRDRKEHTQAAAACRDQKRLCELKTVPITDHKHPRNDEDDGG